MAEAPGGRGPASEPDEPPEPPSTPEPEPPEPEPPSTPEPDSPSTPIPPPPWRTGTIRMLRGDEVLGLAFYGVQAVRSVAVQLAGGALAGLDELVTVLAAAKYGHLGRRGPVGLPSGIGALRLVHVEFGSAAFYFTSGEGEALLIPVESGGPDPTSRLADVADDLLTIVEARGADDVLAVARQYGDRVAAKYAQLLEVVVAEEVDTEWRTRTRDAEMPARVAGEVLATLERTDEIRSETITPEGMLYEANARSRGFRLLQEDGLLIFGRFPPELAPEIGAAWNHRVRASIRVRVERLARSGEERRSFELLGLEVLGPADLEPPPTAG